MRFRTPAGGKRPYLSGHRDGNGDLASATRTRVQTLRSTHHSSGDHHDLDQDPSRRRSRCRLATVAFASDNGDGARTLNEVRAVQQNMAGTLTEGRNAAVMGEYTYGDSSVERPMPQAGRGLEGRDTGRWTAPVKSFEYRGSAN